MKAGVYDRDNKNPPNLTKRKFPSSASESIPTLRQHNWPRHLLAPDELVPLGNLLPRLSNRIEHLIVRQARVYRLHDYFLRLERDVELLDTYAGPPLAPFFFW